MPEGIFNYLGHIYMVNKIFYSIQRGYSSCAEWDQNRPDRTKNDKVIVKIKNIAWGHINYFLKLACAFSGKSSESSFKNSILALGSPATEQSSHAREPIVTDSSDTFNITLSIVSGTWKNFCKILNFIFYFYQIFWHSNIHLLYSVHIELCIGKFRPWNLRICRF